MRRRSLRNNPRERSMVTSAIFLGGLFAVSAAPCSKAVASLVLLGVPLVTFAIAAPSSLSLLEEIKLLWSGLQAFVLRSLCRLTGRVDTKTRIERQYANMVTSAYSNADPYIAEAIEHDPLRFAHARRLASLAGGLGLLAGIGLPFVFPSVYTFGDGLEAAWVFGIDVLAFGLASRIVSERIVVRMFEASYSIRDGEDTIPRARAVPVLAILGGALGSIGSLVIVTVGAFASAFETWLTGDAVHGFAQPALWFLRWTAGDALHLGIGAGVILGIGVAYAQRHRE